MILCIIERRLVLLPAPLPPYLRRRQRVRLPFALFVLVMAAIATASGLVTGYFIGLGDAAITCPAPKPSSKKTNSLMRTV